MTEQLLAALAADERGRLHWKLCRLFGVAPWSRLGRELSEEMCLVLAGQWVLDERERQQIAAPASGNPAFDLERFRKLKGEGNGGMDKVGGTPVGS